jgi:hypothetical protein
MNSMEAARRAIYTAEHLVEASLWPHADLSSTRLQKLHAKTSAEQSSLGSEMIASGRGYEKPNETRTKTDPLALRVNDAADRMYHIQQEISRRNRFHGKMTPLPKQHRQSFYGGGDDRRL